MEEMKAFAKKMATPHPCVKETVDWAAMLDRFLCPSGLGKDIAEVWEYAVELEPDTPLTAFLSTLGLVLVGPFSFICAERWGMKVKEEVACHQDWRTPWDSPEFVPCAIFPESGEYWGFWRDDPNEKPAFVGCKTMGECKIRPIADTLLQGLWVQCQNTSRTPKRRKTKTSLSILDVEATLLELLKALELDPKNSTQHIEERTKQVVADTLDGVGIVVPSTQYRPMIYNKRELMYLFKRYQRALGRPGGPGQSLEEEMINLLTNVDLSNDEGDFGQGVELGRQLFAYSLERFFRVEAVRLLRIAYGLLKREAFQEVLQAQLKRGRQPQLAILL